jgi:hypothetical protein
LDDPLFIAGRRVPPRHVRLCNGKQELAFVTAWMIHCLHKILHTEEQVLKATDEQVRSVMADRCGVDIDDKSYYRLKDRFITRPGKPASKFELLRELVKGKRAHGQQPGTPSEYALTGMEWLFTQDLLERPQDEPEDEPIGPPDDEPEEFDL